MQLTSKLFQSELFNAAVKREIKLNVKLFKIVTTDLSIYHVSKRLTKHNLTWKEDKIKC